MALLLELPGTRVQGRAIAARWTAPGAAPEAAGWKVTPIRSPVLGIVHLAIGSTYPPDDLTEVAAAALGPDDRHALRTAAAVAHWTARLAYGGDRLVLTLAIRTLGGGDHPQHSLELAGVARMTLAAWRADDVDPAQMRFGG